MKRAVFYSGHPDVPSTGRAGYATHIRGMVSGFQECGVHVQELIRGDATTAPARIDHRPSESTPNGLSIRSNLRRILPNVAWNSVRDARLVVADRRGSTELAQTLDEGEFDFVYERHAHLHREALGISRARGAHHVLEVNSPPDERAALGGRSGLDRLAMKNALSLVEQTDVAVFVSTALRKHYEQLLGGQLPNAIVVPNAVLESDYPIRTLNTRSSSSGEDLNIGFVGSLLRWHGVDLLLEAFVEVHKERPHTRLTIVGDGELRHELEARSTALGLDLAVDFVGAVGHDAALRLVADFDIGVMVNSNWYGSPVKLFEYGACGCAIIAPTVEPAHEVLVDGVEAAFTTPDAVAIAGVLMSLIDDEALRHQLGAAAQRRVLTNYTWRQAAATVLDAISTRGDR